MEETECEYGCGFVGDAELMGYHLSISTGGYCKVDRDELDSLFEPVTVEELRGMGDDMLYPTYNIFGEWE